MRKYDLEIMRNYLQLIHPKQMQGYLITWLIMLNIIGLPTVLIGSVSILFRLLFIPIIILDIWILVMRINVERWQKIYILFVGVFCGLMSTILLIASFRLYKMSSNPNEIAFLYLTLIPYLIIVVLGSIYHVKALENGYYIKASNNNSNKYLRFLMILSVSGMITGRIILSQIDDQDIIILITSIITILLAYALALGIHNIHKYYLICQYQEIVKTYSLKKRRRKRRKV